jgi:hypothetical protein
MICKDNFVKLKKHWLFMIERCIKWLFGKENWKNFWYKCFKEVVFIVNHSKQEIIIFNNQNSIIVNKSELCKHQGLIKESEEDGFFDYFICS